jgi:hypothetical protein
MTHFVPKFWTAAHVALATAATWLLCETDTLGGMAPLFFH